MTTIILDTELNGTKRQDVCQLSYIICENGDMTGKNFFFAVDSMNEYAQKMHGFSKMRLYELSRGRTFRERFNEFFDDFILCDLVCGHNVKADVRALNRAFGDVGYAFPNCRTFDTMSHFEFAVGAKNKFGKHKPPRLDELCKFFGLTDEKITDFCVSIFGESACRAHDARFDTAATTLCILEGQKRGDVKGVI